jgi:predicted Zn-dependent protease
MRKKIAAMKFAIVLDLGVPLTMRFKNNVNLEQGLTWINQAITQNNNFINLSIKSNILKKMGKTEDADKIMNDAMASATEIELNAYGYQLLGSGNNDKAIEVLTFNTKRFLKAPIRFTALANLMPQKEIKRMQLLISKNHLV